MHLLVYKSTSRFYILSCMIFGASEVVLTLELCDFPSLQRSKSWWQYYELFATFLTHNLANHMLASRTKFLEYTFRFSVLRELQILGLVRMTSRVTNHQHRGGTPCLFFEHHLVKVVCIREKVMAPARILVMLKHATQPIP